MPHLYFRDSLNTTTDELLEFIATEFVHEIVDGRVRFDFLVFLLELVMLRPNITLNLKAEQNFFMAASENFSKQFTFTHD